TVRIMSRRAPREDEDRGVEWAQAQIETGEGIAEAMQGVNVIVHCASSPFAKQKEVDIHGTARVLDAGKAAGVEHFVYISIVGIDRIPFTYYKAKLAAEEIIRNAS